MEANQFIREVETVFKTNVEKKVRVKCSKDTYKLFRDIENSTQEKLVVLHLDVDSDVICFQVVHIGTINEAFCNPGDIFRTALLTGAVSLIVLHNHPSGNIDPSESDKEMFNAIKGAARLFGIKILDLIIIGNNKYYSAADEGEV